MLLKLKHDPKLAEKITKLGNETIRIIEEKFKEYELNHVDINDITDEKIDFELTVPGDVSNKMIENFLNPTRESEYEDEIVAIQENFWLPKLEKYTADWFRTGEEIMDDFMKNSDNFEVGCIVRSTNGGPEMEVVEINGDYIKVEWENNFGSYHKDLLIVVKTLIQVNCEKNEKNGWCTDTNRKYCSILQDGNCPKELYCEDGEWSVLLKPKSCVKNVNYDITVDEDGVKIRNKK